MRRRRLMLILPLALGLSIALVSSAAAGPGSVRDFVYGGGGGDKPAFALSPDTQLGNDQFIKVHWHGYGKYTVVYFRQCTAHPKSPDSDCTAIYSDPGFSNSEGEGTLYQHVLEGDVPSQNGGKFTCGAAKPCTFGVFKSDGLSSGKLQPIKFAPTPDGCPTPNGAAIVGGGANQANHAMFDWGVQVCQPPAKLGVNYISANSQDGLENFVKGLNDFAVTSRPFTSDQQTELSGDGKSVKYAPITTSGLVLAYKIFDQDPAHAAPGAQIDNLKLTPQLVAQIFTGQISNWHVDQGINELNPGHQFPPLVRPLVRGDHSDANLEFTSWLTAEGGSGLPDDWPGASSDYPLVYLTQNAGIVGGDALANAIADPASVQNNNDYFSTGYIGFIDSSEAAYYGLPVAQIENAAGKFVAATPATIGAALKDSKKGPGGLMEPNYAASDPKAYPMPVVSYLAAPTSGISDASGTTLRGFLHYIVSQGRKRVPGGYVPLSAALASSTTKIVKQIPGSTPAVHVSGNGPFPSSGGSGGTTPGGSFGDAGDSPGGLGTPPPAGSGGGSGGGAPTTSSGTTVAGIPTAALAETAGRYVLPGVIGLCLAAVLGGLLLFNAGSDGPGIRATVRGWIHHIQPGKVQP
jgi:ABC-type phosphate transport system substrate-binding protein